MIAVIGADLRRAHSLKHKKCRHLKLSVSVIIKQIWVTLRCTACYLFALKKKRDPHN